MPLPFALKPEHLPAVLVFARVAQCGSFTRAAGELGVSPSALSQSVRALEARMGVRLLNRTTRNVALTEHGAAFLARVAPGLEQIGAAFGEIDDVRGRPSGTLRLNLSRIAAKMVVMPVLGEFTARYPDVKLEISLTDAFVDLVAGGFDAGMRLGESLAKDTTAVRVSEKLRIAVVGSPQYFEEHGKPKTPADLRTHDCIGYRFLSSGAMAVWEFERGGREIKVEVSGRVTISDHDFMLECARQGIGLAYVFDRAVEADVRAGRLVRVLEDWCQPFPGLYLYYPSPTGADAQMPLKLRVFIDFLQSRLPRPRRR